MYNELTIAFYFLSNDSSGRVKVMIRRHELLLDVGMFHCS